MRHRAEGDQAQVDGLKASSRQPMQALITACLALPALLVIVHGRSVRWLQQMYSKPSLSQR